MSVHIEKHHFILDVLRRILKIRGNVLGLMWHWLRVERTVSAPLSRHVCPLCVHCSSLEPRDTLLPLNDTTVELNILGSGDSTSHYRVEEYPGWFWLPFSVVFAGMSVSYG